MERHGEGDHDQVSIRSLPTVTEVSGATSSAYAGGKGIQPPASYKYSVLRNRLHFSNPAPAGLKGHSSSNTKVTVRVVAGGEMRADQLRDYGRSRRWTLLVNLAE